MLDVSFKFNSILQNQFIRWILHSLYIMVLSLVDIEFLTISLILQISLLIQMKIWSKEKVTCVSILVPFNLQKSLRLHQNNNWDAY